MKVMSTQGEINNLNKRWADKVHIFTWLWFSVICLITAWGALNRNQGYLSPENGLGYWLGISGGTMMLLLLIYSARKRFRSLVRFFKVSFWFRFHMTLGVLGPVFILFHSNFHLGSLNSTVALSCMLIVAGSGLIGRYFYTRIHFGLYGEKIRLSQVAKDMQVLKEDLKKLAVTEKQLTYLDKIFAEIAEFSSGSTQPSTVWETRKKKKRAKYLVSVLEKFVSHLLDYYGKHPELSLDIKESKRSLKRDTSILDHALHRLPTLIMFERLFSLWHIFHIPFFIMMIITAITHVVVVHMY